MLTAYSYAELARVYPGRRHRIELLLRRGGAAREGESAATGDTPGSPSSASGGSATSTTGSIPGIMVAFTATLFGYIYGVDVPPHADLVAARGRGGALRVRRRLHRVPGDQRLDVDVDRHPRHPDRLAGRRSACVHRVPPGPPARRSTRSSNAAKVIIPHSYINMLYQSTIAILLLVGFESITALGAEAINPDQGHQARRVDQPAHPGRHLLPLRVLRRELRGRQGTVSSGSGKTLVTGYNGGRRRHRRRSARC